MLRGVGVKTDFKVGGGGATHGFLPPRVPPSSSPPTGLFIACAHRAAAADGAGQYRVRSSVSAAAAVAMAEAAAHLTNILFFKRCIQVICYHEKREKRLVSAGDDLTRRRRAVRTRPGRER